MNKDNYPSWMLPVVALFAVLLGVNRLSTTSATNEDTSEQTPPSTKKQSVTGKHKNAGEVSADDLLFYEHDAFHILRKFFDAENLAEDKKVEVEVTLKEKGFGFDAAFKPDKSEEASHRNLWKVVGEGLTGPNKYALDFMIVGVPDPEASRLSMETDWTLDMVQRGLEASSHRFVLDRFDLPWRLRVRGELPEGEEEEPRQPDQEPGFMLFRCGKIPAENHLLLVFLVGETPTAGVQKTALTRAIAQMVALTNLKRHGVAANRADRKPWQSSVEHCKSESPSGLCSETVVPVLGPHYTGSAPSYLLAFQHWNGSIRFDCVTGSATGISAALMDRKAQEDQFKVMLAATQWRDLGGTEWLQRNPDDLFNLSFAAQESSDAEEIEWLRNDPEAHWITPFAAKQWSDVVKVEWLREHSDEQVIIPFAAINCADAKKKDRLQDFPDCQFHVSFTATQWPDGAKRKLLPDYLRRHFRATRDEIAILSESNTGYGAVGFPSPNRSNADYSASDSAPALTEEDPTEPLEIPFPLHISRLRNSNDESAEPSAMSAIGPGSHPFLPLTAKKKEEDDLLPPFSRLESASNWRVLEATLATLRRQRVRFVVIRATNIEDVIFLAHQVQTNCPDTMIFVLSTDDLFLNPDAIIGLRGTVMLTTYPLLPDNQEWTRLGTKPLHRVIHFPVQGAEGTYNAVLALLSEIHMASGNKDEGIDELERMLDYRNPFDHKSLCCPPLWMTAVGRDAMWPIEFFPLSYRRNDEPEALEQAFAEASEYIFAPQGAPNFIDNRRRYEHRIAQTVRFPRGTETVFLSLWLLVAYFAVVLGFPERWFWKDRTFAGTLIKTDRPRKTLFTLFFWLGLWLLSVLLIALSFFPAMMYVWEGYSDANQGPQWAFFSAILLALGISLLPVFQLCRIERAKEMDRKSNSLLDGGLSLVTSDTASETLIAATFIAIAGTWAMLALFMSSIGRFHAPSDLGSEVVKFFRLVNLGSGLSTILPLLYVDLGAMVWALSNLRRITFAERISNGDSHESDLGFSVARFPQLPDLERSVNQSISTPYLYRLSESGFVAAVTMTGVLLGCVRYGLKPERWHMFHATIENQWFYPAFWTGLLVVGIALVWELAHTFALWQMFRLFLDRVSGETFLRAFRDEKDDNFRPLFSISMSYSDLTIVRLAIKEAKRHCELTGWASTYLRAAQLDLIDLEKASGMTEIARHRIILNQSMRNLTRVISVDPSTQAAQRFLFLRVFDYCQRIGHGLRNLMFWTSSGLFLLLLAISSYQFPNDDSLLRLGWIFMLAAIFISILVLVEMNRERVLSIFSGGTPGKIDWNSGFVFHVLTLALLPFLGLLGVQFPATFQSTATWIASLFGSVPHP
jgi:hypothetical protein